MKLALIGLGKMGSNMARRLIRKGHSIVAYDQNPEVISVLKKEGVIGVHSLEELCEALDRPAIVWLMLPAGRITEDTIQKLSKILNPADILVDGGNSYFKDDMRRSNFLQAYGIRYLDVGTSGGVWGLDRGYSLMIGGDESAFQALEPVFISLAPGEGTISVTAGRNKKDRTAEQGYLYCGPAGAGHFVKMIHNGIEYGMMQALAEGFDILKGASDGNNERDYHYEFDLQEIAEVWRRGSVVSSWLLDLIALALNQDSNLEGYEGHVPDSGEGRWTVLTAIEEGIPANVISTALYTRFRSRENFSFAEKLLSAMRKQFGGHSEQTVRKKAS